MSSERNPINSLKENLVPILEEPTRVGLRNTLRDNLGEFNEIDFKETWPEYSKIAKHILGFANYGGGCAVIGVKQKKDNSCESVGIESFLDKTEIQQKIQKYLPESLIYWILDISYDASEYRKLVGKKFQVLLVKDDSNHLPFLCKSDGKDIYANRIYTRRNYSTVEANHQEVQKMINRRIETGYSSSQELTLKDHLENLRILYSELAEFSPTTGISTEVWKSLLMMSKSPLVNYLNFIENMIEKEKIHIEKVLGISGEEVEVNEEK